MSPNVIGEDAAVHGQDIQQFQINNPPPPLYEAHFNDPTILESLEVLGGFCREYPMAAGVNIQQFPQQQANGCEIMECVPSYETAVSMLINET